MTATLTGAANVNGIALNDEGFFVDPTTWREDMVPALAAATGITEVTDGHWRVIRFMRSEWERKGEAPSVRVLSKTSGVSIKELYELFPKGPAKTAARLAGVPKPHGCI